MSKVLLSLFLLIVLQVLLTEGGDAPPAKAANATAKPAANKTKTVKKKVCPSGTMANEKGKCIPYFTKNGCPPGQLRNPKGICAVKEQRRWWEEWYNTDWLEVY
ncbi:UNVERIFIED_CONTAM: hypothetical protein PYX00_004215 [Menopon gallinae]|uniref:Uncharacterized protein n=1 Tax=Menopon gallinae TaxID=328185 RepID=A0AAW2I2S9_9NEOP